MRKTKVHNKVLTLLLCSVTYTYDLKLLCETLCNTLYHVVYECSCQTVQ